ncbi:MAG: exodeoxyribonuclease subunit beta [Pseudomonadota bacterium]
MTQYQRLDPLTFPLHGTRLIEASAGTGKTWTIAALYVRLVLGHGDEAMTLGRPLMPPEILVMTFTEAATQELRERIRQRLTEAAKCFRGQAKADAFLQRLLDGQDHQQNLLHARRLQLAADWMDEAAIHTIHGWCNRMLRQHAFDSGSLFNLELEASDQHLLHEVVRDYWRQFFYPLDAHAIPAIGQWASSPDQLLSDLKALLRETEGVWMQTGQVMDISDPPAPDEVLSDWSAWEKTRIDLEQVARASWLAHKDSLELWWREASQQAWLNASRYPPKTLEARLSAMAAWAERAVPCDEKWLAGFAQSRLAMKTAHQDKALQHSALLALDDLIDHLPSQPDVLLALKLHACGWIRQRYASEKQRRARLDFDDLLIQLDSALQSSQGPRLAQVIRQQYPVAMIDEFQDTDPLQYRIFSRVYQSPDAVERSGLFMIGDPKQAIYAFRGADIHTYLQAKRDVAGQLYTLEQNFRSTQSMVSAVNRVFEFAEHHPGGAFHFKSGADAHNPVPFLPVKAQGRPERFIVEGQMVAALQLWLWQVESEEGLCNQAAYQARLAEANAATIVRLLTLADQGQAGFERGEDWLPLKPADMAILVRHRREANAVRAALSARGLRSVYLSDRDSVFKTREACDVLRWLQACAEPDQARLLRAALASESLGLSLPQLEALNGDELRWEAQVEHFKVLQLIWQSQGVLPMLRRLMADFKLPQRLLRSEGGERVLTNLLHLSELLQTASVEFDGEQALIRYLIEQIDDDLAGADESLLRLESDKGLIKVITLHKSKGLEYPLVFMPFIASFREVNRQRSSYFRFHDDQGELCIDLSKSDGSQRQADHERLQEDLRLLYVGLTRAQHACWLGIAPLKMGTSKKCVLHQSALGYVLAGGEAMVAEALAEHLHALRGECGDIVVCEPPTSQERYLAVNAPVPELVSARIFRYKNWSRWWMASYSALVQNLAKAGSVGAEDAPETAQQANLTDLMGETSPSLSGSSSELSTMHAFPRGSQSGVFLHALLEWAAKESFERAANDVAKREKMIAPRCQRRGWHHWIPGLNEWLGEILVLPLPLPGESIALLQLQRAHYQAEMEFWFAAEQVDVHRVDALLCRHIMPGVARPALTAQRLHGMVKGFIDLVFEYAGCYYLIDYKSNWLGGDDSAYSAAALQQAVLEARYDLQYALYSLALHRLLKSRLGDVYDYERHVGGVLYLFVRGIHGPVNGVFRDRLSPVLIEHLDALFAGREGN